MYEFRPRIQTRVAGAVLSLCRKTLTLRLHFSILRCANTPFHEPRLGPGEYRGQAYCMHSSGRTVTLNCDQRVVSIFTL